MKNVHNILNKWVGGKSNHIKYVKTIWDMHKNKRLVEPFCGSLSIATLLQPNQVLANDLNTQLINQYIELNKHRVLNIKALNEESFYYECRSEFNQNIVKHKDILNAPEDIRHRQAELFYYLNRHCFNGLWRVNSKGEFNVAFGKYKFSYCLNEFNHIFDRLGNVEFISADFSAIKLDDNDFVFADPPYVTEFTNYTENGFSWKDQVRVCEWLKDFKGPAIVCNQRTDETEKLYANYGYQIIDTKRPKNFLGKKSEKSKQEVMAIKNI